MAYFKGWRYAEPRDHSNYNLLMRFLCVYSSAALVYFLLFNALYLNTRITAGEVKMPFGEYVQNNMSWMGIKESLKQLLETLKNFGWVEFFLHFIDIMSPESFQVDALKVSICCLIFNINADLQLRLQNAGTSAPEECHRGRNHGSIPKVGQDLAPR